MSPVHTIIQEIGSLSQIVLLPMLAVAYKMRVEIIDLKTEIAGMGRKMTEIQSKMSNEIASMRAEFYRDYAPRSEVVARINESQRH